MSIDKNLTNIDVRTEKDDEESQANWTWHFRTNFTSPSPPPERDKTTEILSIELINTVHLSHKIE